MALGIATLAGGVSLARQTLAAYSESDVPPVRSAHSFRVWLRDQARQSYGDMAVSNMAGDDTSGDTNTALAKAIAARLLLSPIQVRREIAAAAVSGGFFDGVVASERDRQILIIAMAAGVRRALASAPAAGDLWLAAAYLETVSTGFGPNARRALANSWLMAPRAASLAPARLRFAASLGDLLGVRERASMDRDRALVQTANAEQGVQVANRLATFRPTMNGQSAF